MLQLALPLLLWLLLLLLLQLYAALILVFGVHSLQQQPWMPTCFGIVPW